jgi:STE24 endopeptidase
LNEAARPCPRGGRFQDEWLADFHSGFYDAPARISQRGTDPTYFMNAFSIVFLCALALTTGLRLWLALRHLGHVASQRDVVPAAFSGDIDAGTHRKAADYTCAKTRLAIAGLLLEVAIVLWLTFGGGLQMFQNWVQSWLDSSLARGIALIVVVTIVTQAIELPISLYRTFRIEERFGFNKITLKLFVADLLKHALLTAVIGVPLIACVLWLMERSGGLWWIYAWLVWVVFNVLVLAIYPTWIAPLFNKFSPLQDAELRARIERLLHKCGFKVQGLMVMDGSRRSSHGNAYFTGFGKTKRIVFFDTLLARLEPLEIEAVLAHELGHFKLRHVIKRMAWIFGASLVFLAILAWLMNTGWFYSGLNVTTPSTAIALVLFFLIVPYFTFLAQPLLSGYSRRHEFEADRYAAQNASAAALVSALVKLYMDNASTLTPDPLHSAFYDSHPPATLRIARLQAHA